MRRLAAPTTGSTSATIPARRTPLGHPVPRGEFPSELDAGSANSASAHTTESMLRRLEVSRLRMLAAAMLPLGVLGLIAAVALAEGGSARWLGVMSVGVVLGTFARIGARLSTGTAIEPATINRLMIMVCCAVVTGNVAFGLLSVFSAAVTFGLVVLSSSTAKSYALHAYLLIATGYGLAAALQGTGIVVVQPIVPNPVETGLRFWLSAASAEFLFLAAYATGRAIQKNHTQLVEGFERAVRAASQQEALLREARDALQDGAGIGSPGRFSAQQIGAFVLGNVLGRGGMGEVYEAQSLKDGREAAVKLLRAELTGDRDLLMRFGREARIARSVESPHVVRVLDVSEPDAVFPYIAMERLRGFDLASHLRERGFMDLKDAAELASHVAAGLEAAHRSGIVHRDVKPNNIFATRQAGSLVWKVLDFGISKIVASGEATLTSAQVVGTPRYMAPEQARGDSTVDARTDVYGLSAVIYRAVTGEVPFGADMPAVLRMICEEMPRAPRKLRRVPEDVDLVLALGLAKRAEDRFATAMEMARAFEQAVRGALDEHERERARHLLARTPYRT